MAQGLLIDMDGVVYGGETMIPEADVFIGKLLQEQIPFMFMTNNSQRTRLEAVRKLARLGIKVTENHIYNSAMATGKFLASQIPEGTAYVLGEGGLLSSLHENGIRLVTTEPDFVVLGEGRNFTLEMVQRAVDMILAGAKFVITNRDPSFIFPDVIPSTNSNSPLNTRAVPLNLSPSLPVIFATDPFSARLP